MLFSDRKVVVTSGATNTPLDEIRFITNISRGSFGAMIADEMSVQGAEVYYLHGRYAEMPYYSHAMHRIEIRTVPHLLDTLERLLKNEDISVVVHAMAVSDFQIDRIETADHKVFQGRKLAAGQHLTVHLRPTPNIIPKIKAWKRDVYLVGFELEPVESDEDLVEIGASSIVRNDMDFAVVRKLEQIKRDDHEAMFVNARRETSKHYGRSRIARELVRAVAGELALA